MKDSGNLQQKVQEFCDCFGDSDYLKEMSEIEKDPDASQAALRWISLAAMHGINANAKKITLRRTKDGSVTVTATYRDAQLPSPGKSTGGEIVAALKQITHMDQRKVKMPLALGIRDSSVELKVKITSSDNKDKVSLQFG